MSYDADVNKLIQAALDQCESLPMHTVYALEKALEPFRKQRPRVGWLRFTPESAENVKAIELTEAVRTRLGPTAGVDRERIYRILEDDVGRCDGALVDAIMAQLKDAGVEVSD